jgi:hypothetical protein
MTTTKKTDLRRRLAKIRAEYKRAVLEVDRLRGGNGFATQAQMREEVSHLYLSTICKLERMLL